MRRTLLTALIVVVCFAQSLFAQWSRNNGQNTVYLTNNGDKVGIGTSSPGEKLHVIGTAAFEGAFLRYTVADGTTFDLKPLGQYGFGIRLKPNSAAGGDANRFFQIGMWDGNNVYYPLVHVNDNGMVGIGTTTPGYKLSVNGVIQSSTGGFRFPDNSVQTTAWTGGGSGAVSAASVTNGAFGANGGAGTYSFPSNVGIAVTNPNTLLQIAGDLSQSAFAGNGAQLSIKGATAGNKQLHLGFQTSEDYGVIQTLNYGTQWGQYPLALQPLSGRVGVGTYVPGADFAVRVANPPTGPITSSAGLAGKGILLQADGANLDAKAGVYFRGSESPGVPAGMIFGRYGAQWGTYVAFHTHPDDAANIDSMLERMRIDGNGNVGIGTAAPTMRLELNHSSSNTTYAGSASQFGLGLVNANGTTDSWSHISFAQAGGGSVKASVGAQFRAGGTDLVLGTSNGSGIFERMRIKGDGNVGIGTADANYPLTVVGVISAGAGVRFPDGNIQMAAWTGGSGGGGPVTAGDVGAGTFPVGAFIFPGTVGVGGNPNPNKTLTVTGTGSFSSNVYSAGGYFTAPGSVVGLSGDADFRTYLYSPTGNEMVLRTNGAERARIDSSGNVGIGTAAPADKLSVYGVVSATGGVRFPDGNVQMAAWTGSSGSINASAVGAGTFPVGSFTFQNDLTVSGAASFRNPGPAVEVVGQNGAPAYVRFNQTANAGKIWRAGNTGGAGTSTFDIHNESDNLTALSIASTGYVGIGTTNPSARLQVAGDARLGLNFAQMPSPSFGGLVIGEYAAGGPGELQLLTSSSANGYGFKFQGNSGDTSLRLQRRANSPSWTDFMSWTTDGKVGIGTNSPQNALEIRSTPNRVYTTTPVTMNLVSDESFAATPLSGTGIGFIGKYAADGSTTILGAISGVKENQADGQTGGALIFGAHTNTTVAGDMEKMRLTSTGRLGINNKNPLKTLDVDGEIYATGSISSGNAIYANYQDLAEWVPSAETLEPGTVVVLDPASSNHVIASTASYDTTVAGVVSLNPGIVLGRGGADKAKVATTGRVKVRVDASVAPIQIGDLLVTSDKPGVAMKSLPMQINGRKFHQPGTLLGKALEPLERGQGEILILLSLQ